MRWFPEQASSLLPSSFRYRAKDQSVDAICRFILRVAGKVRIDAEGDSYVAMAESLADHLDVLPVVEEQSSAQDTNVESADTIAEQNLITRSCGMNHLPRHIAFGKLQAIAGAKRILGG